jgi:hypothetical protein
MMARGRAPGHARAHSLDEDMTGKGPWSYRIMKPTASAAGSTSAIDKSNSAPNADTSAGPRPKSDQQSSASLTALVTTSISHLSVEAPANGIRQMPLEIAEAEPVFARDLHRRKLTAGP